MIRTQISITEEQQEALQRLAAARNVSQAAVLREALELLIGEDVRLRRLERARQLAGKYHADDNKRYADHDAALDDAFSA
jgi:Arc/MetJ-type ribon-helix-helix transcriptional regulator